MQVTIKKGVPERLEDYVDVMRDSALWDHYYVPDESLLRDTLAECSCTVRKQATENKR